MQPGFCAHWPQRWGEEKLYIGEAMEHGSGTKTEPRGTCEYFLGAAVSQPCSLAIGQPVQPDSQREEIHPSRELLEEHIPQGQLVQGPHGGMIRGRSWQERGLGGKQGLPSPRTGKTVLGWNPQSPEHLPVLELEGPLGSRQWAVLGLPRFTCGNLNPQDLRV